MSLYMAIDAIAKEIWVRNITGGVVSITLSEPAFEALCEEIPTPYPIKDGADYVSCEVSTPYGNIWVNKEKS